MNANDVHLEGLRWAYDLLGMVMADATDEMAHTTPPGNANPLASTYAHALLSLDHIPRVFLQGKAPLYEGAWAGRTGISEIQWYSSADWARRVQVDLPAAAAYGRAVYEDTAAFIASLDDVGFARQVDMTSNGLGVQTVSWCISALVISHLNNMAGEISVLKGIQGHQGYPF